MRCSTVLRVGAGREFDDAEGACLDVEDGQVGDYAVHEGLTGERKGAFADQRGTAVFERACSMTTMTASRRGRGPCAASPGRRKAIGYAALRPGERSHGYGACEDAGQSRIVTVTSKLELASWSAPAAAADAGGLHPDQVLGFGLGPRVVPALMIGARSASVST